MKKPRPRPLNPRQEKFAQLVAQGLPASQAYVEAGYSKQQPDATANGCLLLKTPRVAARVAEIQNLAASLDTTLLTIVEKRRFLAEVVHTPVGSIGPDSRLCQEFYEKTKKRTTATTQAGGTPSDDNAAETVTDPTTEADTVILWRRIKMPDKLRAIDLDSKLAGHFPKAAAGLDDDEEDLAIFDLETIREIAERVRIVSPLLMGLQHPSVPPSVQ
ncbi:terminase small subunit [Haloferula sp. BvORR071]|uniref:terminase small subunit n=1 Tax=Haloferula sp. BvORR071 TaxID=1396141 RepID=UPI002240F2E4|nr:terminase small subunit [Haloferula sp. BvORR071]